MRAEQLSELAADLAAEVLDHVERVPERHLCNLVVGVGAGVDERVFERLFTGALADAGIEFVDLDVRPIEGDCCRVIEARFER